MGWDVELDATGLIIGHAAARRRAGRLHHPGHCAVRHLSRPVCLGTAYGHDHGAPGHGSERQPRRAAVPWGHADPNALPGDTNLAARCRCAARPTRSISPAPQRSHTPLLSRSRGCLLAGPSQSGAGGADQHLPDLAARRCGGQLGLYVQPGPSALPGRPGSSYPFTVSAEATDALGLAESAGETFVRFRGGGLAWQVTAAPPLVYGTPGGTAASAIASGRLSLGLSPRKTLMTLPFAAGAMPTPPILLSSMSMMPSTAVPWYKLLKLLPGRVRSHHR